MCVCVCVCEHMWHVYVCMRMRCGIMHCGTRSHDNQALIDNQSRKHSQFCCLIQSGTTAVPNKWHHRSAKQVNTPHTLFH